MVTYIGIDNGVSGSIGIIHDSDYLFFKMPTKSEQNYTKAKANVTRIDVIKLDDIFQKYILNTNDSQNIVVMIERPMVNPGRFKATTSALRALEAVLVYLESRNIGINYLDSKEWQKQLLPSGLKGEELKKASLDIGNRMFPLYSNAFEKQKDADGMLIAEHCRRKFKL